MKKIFSTLTSNLSTLTSNLSTLTLILVLNSCIEPPLRLPGETVMVDVPIVLTEMEVVWNVDVDWKTQWYYGWDTIDESLWGKIEYPKPTSYEVRRYYLGNTPHKPHTEVDAFSINETHFRRYYNFGYYDLLIWSDIDSEEGVQSVVINEENLDEVTATTSGTRGMSNIVTRSDEEVTAGLYNQPEIFYSTYPRDVYISRNFDDYDYYDEVEMVWVKKINATLNPLVYYYLVQIIIYNNDGRITGVNGNNAISGFASSTSVNTGHTSNSPGMIYFESRMKQGIDVNGRSADIIGGKLTTFGLCGMERWEKGSSPIYNGSRKDLKNSLFFDLTFNNGKEKTFEVDVTEQCQKQCHGGVITVVLDANDIDIPSSDDGPGSLFVPTVEDYDEVIWEVTI
ncbi:MAG: hypothetical protein KBT33_00220 [Prevotellaceae bacterium]|nr:hypothetical protein [Candidatus Minthosoma equi]